MANRTSEISAEEVPGSPLRRSSRIATASPVPGAAAIPNRRRSSASAEPTFPAAAKLTRTKRLSLSHETGDERPSTPTKLARARAGSKSPSHSENEKAPGTPSRRTRRSSISKIVEEPEEVSPTTTQSRRSTRSQSKSPERPKRGRPSLASKSKKLEAIDESDTKTKTEPPKKPATRGRRSSLSTRRGSTDNETEEDKSAKPETKKVTRRSTRAASVELDEVEENKTKIDLKAIEEDVEHEESEVTKDVEKKSVIEDEGEPNNKERRSVQSDHIESQKEDDEIMEKKEPSKKTPVKRTSLKIDEDDKKSSDTEVKLQIADSANDAFIRTSNESQELKSKTPLKANLDRSNSPKIEEQSSKNTPEKVKVTPLKSKTPTKVYLEQSTNSPKIEEQSSKNTPEKVKVTPIKPNLDQSRNSPNVEGQSPKDVSEKLKLTPKVLLDRNVVDRQLKKSTTPTKEILKSDNVQSTKSEILQKKRKLSLIPTEENSKQLNLPHEENSEVPESTVLTPSDLHSTSLNKTQESETIKSKISQKLETSLNKTQESEMNKSKTSQKLETTVLDLSNSAEEDSLQKSLEEDDSNILKMSLKVESDKSNDEDDDIFVSKDTTETKIDSPNLVPDKEIESTTNKKLKHDKSLSQVEADSIHNSSSSVQELNANQEEDISNASRSDTRTNSSKIKDLKERKISVDVFEILNKTKENIEKQANSSKIQTPDKSKGSIELHKSKDNIENLDKSHENVLNVSKNENNISKSESPSKKRKLCESINEDNKNKSFKSPKTKTDSLLANECEMTYGSDGSFNLILSIPPSDNSQDTENEKKAEETLNTSASSNNSDKENVQSSPAKAIKPLKQLDTSSTSTPKTDVLKSRSFSENNEIVANPVVTETDNVFRKSLSKSFDGSKLVEKTKESKDLSVTVETVTVDDDEQLNELLDSFVDEVKDHESEKSNTSTNLKMKEVENTEEKLDNNIIELEKGTAKQEKSFNKLRSKRRKIVISEEDENVISSEDESLEEEEEQSNPFIDDEAFEGEEDTPSEDSNEIIERGESLHSEDSDDESDDEDYENDSFIVDDEDLGLLSPEEIDDFKEEKVKKKRTRIIQVSDSESEEDNSVLLIESDEDETTKINVLQDIKIAPEKLAADLEVLKPEAVDEGKILKNIQDLKRTRKASLTISDIDLSQLPEGAINERISKAVDLICSTIKSSGNVSLNISVDYDNDSKDGGDKEAEADDLKEVSQAQDKLNRRSMKRVSLSPVKTANVTEATMSKDDNEVLNISQSQTDTVKLQRRSKRRDSSVLNTSPTREKSPTKAQGADETSIPQEDILNTSQADADKSKRRSKKRDSLVINKRVSLTPVKTANVTEATISKDDNEVLNISQSQTDTDKLKRRSKKRDSSVLNTSPTREKSPTKSQGADETSIPQEDILNTSQADADKSKRRSKRRDSLVINKSPIKEPNEDESNQDKIKRRSQKRDSNAFEKSLVTAVSEDEILSLSHLEGSEDKSRRRSKKGDSLERRRSKSHDYYTEKSSPSKANDPDTDDQMDNNIKKSKSKRRDSLKNVTHEDFKSGFEVEYVTSPVANVEALSISKIMSGKKENIEEVGAESKTKKKSLRRQSYDDMNKDQEVNTEPSSVDTFEIEKTTSPPKKSKSSKRLSLQDQFEIDEAEVVESAQPKKRKSDEFNVEILSDKKSKKIKAIEVPKTDVKPVEIKKNKSKKKMGKITPYTNLDYIPQTDFEETVASPQKAHSSEVKSKKMKHVTVKPSKVRNTSEWDIEEAKQAKPSLKNEKKSEQQLYFEKLSPKDFKNRMLFDPSRIKRTDGKKLLIAKAKAKLMSNR